MSDSHRYTIAADWLTTTWPSEISATPLQSTSAVIDWARRRAHTNGAGDWVKPWAWQGYKGYQVGPVCVGERVDSSIVKLSSIAAHDWFSAGFPIGHNVSRLDIAMTVFGVSDIDTVIARHKDEALEKRNALRLAKFGVRTINTYGAGDTLYVGSRNSAQLLRIYNKDKEQTGNAAYAQAIRYEAEYHDDHARQAAARIFGASYTPARCWSVLEALLTRRGISPVVGLDTSERFCFTTDIPKSDTQRALKWLSDQVSPTVRRLLRDGLYDEVFEALGIGVIDKWRGE